MSPNSPPKQEQRIAKLLARAGVASRREIERMIAEGRIALNGQTVDTPATLLSSLHGVTVDGNAVEAPRPARLFVFHKPNGVLVTEHDPKGRPTIYDHLPADLPRVMPVGRLDLNTEGLLLLTTDGELKRQLELPSTGVERAYRVRAYGDVSQEQLEALIEGVEIDGVRYGPIDANLERRTGANVWIEMILTEGKNREVRRVLEHLGLQVSRLIRIRYGPFILADMPVGAIGEVRQHDLVAFRQRLAKGGRDDQAVIVELMTAAGSRAARAAPAGDGAQRRPSERPGRPDRSEGQQRPGGRAPRAGPARGRAANPEAGEANAARPLRASRPARSDAPATGRDGSTIARSGRPVRPTRAKPGDAQASGRDAPAADKPARPKRGAGWAKAKPRPKPGGRRR